MKGFTLCPKCLCLWRKLEGHKCEPEPEENETSDYYSEQQDSYYGTAGCISAEHRKHLKEQE